MNPTLHTEISCGKNHSPTQVATEIRETLAKLQAEGQAVSHFACNHDKFEVWVVPTPVPAGDVLDALCNEPPTD